MGYLKSLCDSSYWSSIEISTKLLCFWENRVFVYAFWRQTDRRTDGQHHSIKRFDSSNLITGSYLVQNGQIRLCVNNVQKNRNRIVIICTSKYWIWVKCCNQIETQLSWCENIVRMCQLPTEKIRIYKYSGAIASRGLLDFVHPRQYKCPKDIVMHNRSIFNLYDLAL